MKFIYLLGSTGSIGTQTLEVVKNHQQEFRLIGCSLGSDHLRNIDILETFQPKIASLRDDGQMDEYMKKYPNIEFVYGDAGLVKVAKYPEKGLLINALSGSVGL